MKKLEIVEADLANKEHADAVLNAINTYARDPMGMNQPLAGEVQKKLIRGMKDFPCSFSLIAFFEEEAAGIADCVYSFSTFKAAKVINIHDLAVNPKFRGKGIGEVLITAVEKKAKETGCCKITLEVREDNRARNLYERVGFSYGEPRMFFMEKPIG